MGIQQMVKSLDENTDEPVLRTGELVPIDHVGISLWRAARHWQKSFAEGMAELGFPWHQEARGMVLAHLGPKGRSQADLVKSMGMTKQAVQQLLDQLEANGVIRRVPDPKDKRSKRVELTALGQRDFAARIQVKRRIENQYREKLGVERFSVLVEALDDLIV
jgi:DNA-binding MarR family transcriptional regulator